MISCHKSLTSRWGFYLQIDEQGNVHGVREKDDYCGKITEKSLQFIKLLPVNQYADMRFD